MYKALLTTLTLLLLSQPLQAELKVLFKNRISNRGDGYCSYASLETLAKQHKIKPLYGITELVEKECTKDEIIEGKTFRTQFKSGGAGPVQIEKRLTDLKVKHKIQNYEDKSTDLLIKACQKDLGAVVSLYGYPSPKYHHSVVVTYIDDKVVRVIDSNDPDVDITFSRKFFNQVWTGMIVVIYPDD